MFAIDVVSRILHVATAIVLVGGSVFMLLVLLPAAKAISDEAHQQLAAAVTGRWKRFIHLGILVFLVTGFYNYFQAIPSHKGDGLYHALIGTKMLLAFGIFFIASALVGRSKAFEPMRHSKSKWLTIVAILAACIVGISGFVKVRGTPAGEALKEAPPSSSIESDALPG